MGSCCCSSSSTAGIQVLLEAAIEQLVAFNAGGEGATDLTPLALALVSGATLAADTAWHIAINDSHNKKFIQIINRTDGGVYVSLDNATNHFHITSGSSLTLNLGENGKHWAGNVYLKQDTDAPPSSENVEVSAYY